ncbi:MAG: ribonuclease D [Pseudomonadota bacterium]
MQELYIDNPTALRGLCDRLQGCRRIALDTEFVREKTYYAQFCLLQLATDDLLACVDPLALPDLEPLLAILYREDILKIMHSGHQDLELFFDLRGQLPKPVFDTQITAALLGHGDQVGYANLVASLTGVTLDKTHTRADWSRRPLEPQQIEYALDDVRYLIPMYDALHASLQALGREDWLREDFAELCDERRYRRDDDSIWRRLKGVQHLRGRQLAVARAVAVWREHTAQAQDKPRKWLLGDDIILDIARLIPQDLAKLGRIRGISEAVVRHHGIQILELIRQAAALPKEQWPQLPRIAHLPEEQEPLVDVLMAVARVCAMKHRISINALVSRKEIEQVISGDREAQVLHGWRRELLGNELLAMLQGERALRVEGAAVCVDVL